ncbi:MAG: hypothetical protein K6T91_11030 [Firmicutes bacterium]|nr:hypothetical protein [Bacillota bacterium]
MGPHCRNCHRGSSGCNACHMAGKGGYTAVASIAADNSQGKTVFNTYWISSAVTYDVLDTTPSAYPPAQTNAGIQFKWERSVRLPLDWRTLDTTSSAVCADDGFSWPHRTLGYMMLKDDLFGLDFNGDPIAAGVTRTTMSGTDLANQINGGTAYDDTATYAWLTSHPAHDIDSVCLDCHNPTIWNATSQSHVDSSTITGDEYNDELLLRGLR